MKISNLTKEDSSIIIKAFNVLLAEQKYKKDVLLAGTLEAIIKFSEKGCDTEYTKEEYKGIINALLLYFVTRVNQENLTEHWRILNLLTLRYSKLYGESYF